MKKSTFWIIIFLIFSLTGISKLQAQLVLYENFNYTPPTFIGGNTGATGSNSNNWTTHSITAGQTTTIDVVNGNLSYPGLAVPSGYKVSMFGAANTCSRDINRAITYVGTTLYFSVLLNVTDNSGLTVGGDYFMHFGATAGNSVTTFGGRLGAKSMNAGANYRFMIQNTSGGSPNFTDFPQDLVFGTTYLIVVKYDKSTAPTTATLWVNPVSLGGAESAGGVTNTSGTSTFNTFGSVCFRNNGATPKLGIDEVRVGATWADVTPLPVITPAVQAQDINFTNITATGMTINWTNGNGANRIVKMNTTNSFTNPTDGTDPVANATYGGSGEQVVFNGSSNTVNVAGLTSSLTYWYRVYEYNGSGASTLFLNTTANNNPNSQATSSWIPPTVTTAAVTSITFTTAVTGGNVTADGGYPILARGVCYSTAPNPTISGPHTTEAGTLGIFVSNLSGLTPGTTYYVVAYASNVNVTGYGSEVIFTTAALSVPVLTTNPVTNITYNSALGAGTVTSDGGTPISARGICYSTLHNPVITGTHTTEPGTIGSFTSNIMGLNPQTTYYARAYATSTLGTGYGAEVPFTTLCEPYAPLTNFWASNININVGDAVNFFDSTLYCPTSWNWSFVGGTPMSSTLQNPTGIVFNYPGTFHVCLTTTNNYGTTTTCKMNYITVTGPPIPADVNLVISEIMYNPPETGADSLEFIELYNNDTKVANLENFIFSEGVEFTFPSVDMAPHTYLVIAKNSAAMQHTFGVASLQWTSGSLSNSGELIRIKDYNGFTVDSVVYNDILPWDTLANGFGPSLEFCDPDSNNALAENWRHAVEFAAINAAGDSIWASPGTGCKYPPAADFVADYTAINQGSTVNFTDLSTGIVASWEWTFEGGTPAASLLQTPPAILYDAQGTYDVSLKVTNPDGISIKSRPEYILVGPNGIEMLDPLKTVVIYPNPTSGKFSVIYQKQAFTARILSATDNFLTEKQSIQGKVAFDLSTVQNGIYFIQILDNQGNYIQTKKVIIQK